VDDRWQFVRPVVKAPTRCEAVQAVIVAVRVAAAGAQFVADPQVEELTQ
jgi:hypothetical protein